MGDGAVYQPLPLARGGGGASIRGSATSALLARAVERSAKAHDIAATMRPVRWTLEMLKPAGLVSMQAATAVVRRGRRAAVIDGQLFQEGKLVARATALYGATSSTPPENVDYQADEVRPPEPGFLPLSGDLRVYYSQEVGWTREPEAHQTGKFKQIWCGANPAVQGEEVTAFQQAAAVSDLANMVTNWGNSGITYINADVSLHLARLPVDGEAGVRALTRVAAEGIAVGTAELFDRQGVCGTVTTSAFTNSAHTIDMRRWRATGWS